MEYQKMLCLMYEALCFTFSTSLVGFVIGPKFFLWFRDKYLGGSSSGSQRPALRLGEIGSTRVSGLHLPQASGSAMWGSIPKNGSNGNGSNNQQQNGGTTVHVFFTVARVKELEAEVAELRNKLREVEEANKESTEPPSSAAEECKA